MIMSTPSPSDQVPVCWDGGDPVSIAVGTPWLTAAQMLGHTIPTGCLYGSCGACEIEVNGHVVRACVSSVRGSQGALKVEAATDPYW